ncbi:MAG: response regulator [Candidatus Methylomirabilis sp.]|nr:response regulator [Candidatus Methylomirabilis sp.]
MTKHAQAKSVSVQVKRENRRLRCTIRDDGIGFDASAVQTRKGERGLGLIGIRERLDALGGRLQITSAPGRGRNWPLPSRWRHKMDIRVLLADDHLIVRQGCKALLEREGFEVVGEASDGHEAVRLSRTLQPDVAVLDLAMPLMNGLEASQEIVHVSPRTKSVLLTMYTDDHYVIQALRAGIQGYVVKTQATTDLVQAIHEVTKGAIYLSPTISRAVVDAYLAKTELPPIL